MFKISELMVFEVFVLLTIILNGGNIEFNSAALLCTQTRNNITMQAISNPGEFYGSLFRKSKMASGRVIVKPEM